MLEQSQSLRPLARKKWQAMAAPLALAFASVTAAAQQTPAPPPPPAPTIPYGVPIGLSLAKKAMAAAEAEAMRNGWSMVIVIMDSADHVVMQQKLDNTQYGALAAAEDKARFRCPTKDPRGCAGAGRDRIALFGSSRSHAVGGRCADPRRRKGRGVIGVSGGTAVQDGQVAKVAVEALKQESTATQ